MTEDVDVELEPAGQVEHERLPDGNGWTHYGAGDRLGEFDQGEPLYAAADLIEALKERRDEHCQFRNHPDIDVDEPCATSDMEGQCDICFSYNTVIEEIENTRGDS